jgi:hypothetical protein
VITVRVAKDVALVESLSRGCPREAGLVEMTREFAGRT